MIIYEEILNEFQRQKVKYVLMGGIAMNLLGSLRNTADLDLLVEMSDANLAKIVKILTKRGYHVKQPVDPMGIANAEVRKDWIKNKGMRTFNFYKDEGLQEVGIIIDSPVSYQKAQKAILKIKCAGMVLPVISIDHLIKMKKKAGRDIDQADVEELKLIKKFKGQYP